jgi:prepilin-type N-terminal cleavage/methylation domain-containing protein
MEQTQRGQLPRPRRLFGSGLMHSDDTSRGFTLIEVMIALTLLSVVALSLSTTLISTHRALTGSGRRMQATQLAVEAMEQLRAGQVPEGMNSAEGFDRSAQATLWDGQAGLRRLEVTVSWNDGDTHTLRLVTLARR